MVLQKSCADISWAHAVNSKERLEKYISDTSIDVLEGDIRYVNGSAIMAHPPDTHSDLDFDEWFEKTVASGKGLKLDFKDQEAIEYCLKRIQEFDSKQPIPNPVILNADLLVGPGGKTPRVLMKYGTSEVTDPQDFVNLCEKIYRKGKLSIGWSTSNDDTPYTREHVSAMELLVSDIKSPVTFPVRICKGPQSMEILKELIDYDHPGHRTLTWWNNEVLTDEEMEFIQEIKKREPEFHYIDIIDPHTFEPLTV